MILHITDNIIRNIIFLAKSLCKICGKQSFKSEISTKQLISQCLSLFEAAFQEHTVKAQHMAGRVLQLPCNTVLKALR